MRSFATALALVVLPAFGQVPEDTRQLVEMPPAAQAVLRIEMLDNLGALNELFSLLVAKRLPEAAELAESRLGYSAMGKHAGMARGMGPGRFMPQSMHGIGLAMHGAGSELAKAAKAGDEPGAWAALQQLTANCVACHASFRIR